MNILVQLGFTEPSAITFSTFLTNFRAPFYKDRLKHVQSGRLGRVRLAHCRMSKHKRGDDGERLPSEKRNLELAWRLQTMGMEKPRRCSKCGGDGWAECEVCHSTGMMTLGDRLVCSIDGGDACPVCDGGLVRCPRCKGSGRIAAWLDM